VKEFTLFLMSKYMKSVTQFLSQPKSALPIFAILILGGTFFAWRHIGNAPVVPLALNTTNSNFIITPDGNISLSFPKGGRVQEVNVKEGDRVRKGQVLARLSAPDSLGLVSQAKGALDLARAQYASLNVEYGNTEKQQNILVANAYRTLLSSGLEGVPNNQDTNVPVITGTYTCNKEGSYMLKPYRSSDRDSGYSLKYTGLESGVAPVKYDVPVPLGTCGLQIKFTQNDSFNSQTIWTIEIPNTKSSVYLTNKNAYDLAVTNRKKILDDLLAKVGSTNEGSVAKAQITAAEGAYQAALGAYQNNVITSPINGTVTFIDQNLKIGQTALASKPVISISQK
jgi:multidrug efflux pump subunit AcrA (membrane-fusion protein)